PLVRDVTDPPIARADRDGERRAVVRPDHRAVQIYAGLVLQPAELPIPDGLVPEALALPPADVVVGGRRGDRFEVWRIGSTPTRIGALAGSTIPRSRSWNELPDIESYDGGVIVLGVDGVYALANDEARRIVSLPTATYRSNLRVSP